MVQQPVSDNVESCVGVCLPLAQSFYRGVEEMAHRQEIQGRDNWVCDQQSVYPHIVSGDAHVPIQAPSVGDGATDSRPWLMKPNEREKIASPALSNVIYETNLSRCIGSRVFDYLSIQPTRYSMYTL